MLWSPNTTERLKNKSSSWIASANKIKDDDRKSMVGGGGVSLDSLGRHIHKEKMVAGRYNCSIY